MRVSHLVGWIVVLGARALTAGLRALPVEKAVVIMTYVVRLFMVMIPKYRRIGLRNLEIAYPTQSPAWREDVFQQSLQSLARVFVDFARLPSLSAEWMETHLEVPFLERFFEIKKQHPGKGVLIATGHLGSFELLAHLLPMKGNPIAFVVRNFQFEPLDRWWTATREAQGNKVIFRKGAFREVSRYLEQGRDVAILFDQNVTKNHAVFVDWFGKKAATTKAVALAAIRDETPVVVAGIVTLPHDRYRVEASECDFSALYRDTTLSIDQKVEQISQRIATEYEKIIRMQPGGWFWLHRRWRTRPDSDPENPYAGC